MSEVKTLKVHTPEFKAKVGLEALRGIKTINEMGGSPIFIIRTISYTRMMTDSDQFGYLGGRGGPISMPTIVILSRDNYLRSTHEKCSKME